MRITGVETFLMSAGAPVSATGGAENSSATVATDPPPLKWSTLKYVLRLTGGPPCPRSVTSRKRLLPSYARLM